MVPVEAEHRAPAAAWFVCESLHRREVEKHEGKNEYSLAFWVF